MNTLNFFAKLHYIFSEEERIRILNLMLHFGSVRNSLTAEAINSKRPRVSRHLLHISNAQLTFKQDVPGSTNVDHSIRPEYERLIQAQMNFMENIQVLEQDVQNYKRLLDESKVKSYR